MYKVFLLHLKVLAVTMMTEIGVEFPISSLAEFTNRAAVCLLALSSTIPTLLETLQLVQEAMGIHVAVIITCDHDCIT